MESKYCCSLHLLCHPRYFKDIFLHVVNQLPYTPHSAYCFYHEFNRPPGKEMVFDPQHIASQITSREMEGISAVSIYDEAYSVNNTTPFVRLHFSIPRQAENASVQIEWIAFNNLDFLIQENRVIKDFVIENTQLLYCYLSNQTDTFEQSTSPETWFRKNHGKLIIHNGVEFMAAPQMYFGKAFNKIIQAERLLQAGGQYLQGTDIISITLGNLYADPEAYRKQQKQFWKTIQLNRVIKTFIKENTIDAIKEYSRRFELSKKMK